VIVKVQEQVLAQWRELDSREGVIVAWEESLTSFARTLGEASAEHYASCTHEDAVRWNYSIEVKPLARRRGTAWLF
jgi:hypothetical protein